MAGKTSRKAAKVAKKKVAKKAPVKKGAAKRATKKASTPRGTASKPRGAASKPRGAAPKSNSAKTSRPVLLSGGNPQIAKGYGDEPVQAYIAAMPGWKSAVGRRLDELITDAVPDVNKAVKWNSPLYGVDEGTWFLGIHVFAKYIKVAYFRGASLVPLPPVASKQKEVRYFHIHEDDELDEAQFADWAQQASRLPGEKM